MHWDQLKDEKELEKIKDLSSSQPVLIFKHSTRCSISSTALNRLERHWEEEEMRNVKTYYLDLLSYRSVSNKIEEIFGVTHESPQILLIRDGKCVYHVSQLSIQYDVLAKKCREGVEGE
jgi:bacillithiol system protein YtxJ